MERRGLTLVAMFAVLLVGTGVAAAKPGGLVPGQPVMIALGDSWAAGVGATSGNGYVPQLHSALRERYGCLPARSERAADKCKRLQLVDLAIGGATTPSLLAEQLPTAISLLEDRNGDSNPRNDVEVVTLHVGGNDVTGPNYRRLPGRPVGRLCRDDPGGADRLPCRSRDASRGPARGCWL
jgi:lysophospholipase L1-like esterase